MMEMGSRNTFNPTVKAGPKGAGTGSLNRSTYNPSARINANGSANGGGAGNNKRSTYNPSYKAGGNDGSTARQPVSTLNASGANKYFDPTI